MSTDPRLTESTALRDVLAERERQRATWGDAHDDEHDDEALAAASAYLAWPVGYRPGGRQMDETKEVCIPAPGWAVELSTKCFSNRRREIVIAAALLLAEIERLDRANV